MRKVDRLLARADALQRRADFAKAVSSPEKYRTDPVGYCRDILRVRLTPDQKRIAERLLQPPFKVLVRAGHNVGKSFLAACMISWWYDVHNPGIVLSTAPTERQVKSILWKELRLVRARLGGFAGPAICELKDAPDHYAMGFTARDGDRFQGHHSPAVFIVFDEAVGVSPIFWEAADTMLGGESFAFLGIYNPTDTSSYAYQAEQSGAFAIETLSALVHPNIDAELAGEGPPYPSAIRLDRLRDMMGQWATPVLANEERDGPVVEFDGQKWELGPIAQARLAGQWPSQAINSVFSEKLVGVLFSSPRREVVPNQPLQIGCDPGRFGDDPTTIHVRRGLISLHHESNSGWSTKRTAIRLKELAFLFDNKAPTHKRVPILIDATGIGAGVLDQGEDYNFIPINSSWASNRPDVYFNLRSELWFSCRELAQEGIALDLTRINAEVKSEIQRQLLTPTYTLTTHGAIQVEKKDLTKARLGRSPDDADAFNLAYLRGWQHHERVIGFLRD